MDFRYLAFTLLRVFFRRFRRYDVNFCPILVYLYIFEGITLGPWEQVNRWLSYLNYWATAIVARTGLHANIVIFFLGGSQEKVLIVGGVLLVFIGRYLIFALP